AAAEYQLFFTGGVDEEGGTIGARPVGPVGPPALCSGGLIQGHQVGFGVLIAVQNHQVLVEDGRTAKAVLGKKTARRLLPNQMALHVETGYSHVGIGQKGYPNVPAIGRRGGTGEAVQLMLAL